MDSITISDYISIGFGLIMAFLGVIEKIEKIKWKPFDIFRDKELRKKVEKVEGGILYIQQNSLQKSCVEYLKKGSVTINELKALINLYKSYHDLGGDDFITNMVEQVKKLPIKG